VIPSRRYNPQGRWEGILFRQWSQQRDFHSKLACISSPAPRGAVIRNKNLVPVCGAVVFFTADSRAFYYYFLVFSLGEYIFGYRKSTVKAKNGWMRPAISIVSVAF